MSEAIFIAVLALVCAFSSGWFLHQWFTGWTGEQHDEYGEPLSDEWTPPPFESWMPNRIIEKQR